MNSSNLREGGVVVAIDGSETGHGVVSYAARESSRLDLPLDLVHVLPGHVPAGITRAIGDDGLRSYGEDILEHARAIACESVKASAVRIHLRLGNRNEELIVASQRAHRLVMGRRHSHSLDWIAAGSTVANVVNWAACPVVVVPAKPVPQGEHRRILVGFRSSPHAAGLLDTAFQLADELRHELVVLHAWSLPCPYEDIVADSFDEETWRRDETYLIQRQLAQFRASFPHVRVRLFVRHEDPPRALVRASHGAERLLIMRPALGGDVHHVGRTMCAVLRQAHCPVEILNAPPGGETLLPTSAAERRPELVP